MPNFAYTARDSQSKVVTGTQEATSEALAVGILQSRGLVITKIVAFEADTLEARAHKKKRHGKITAEDRIFFLNQLPMLLEAGIPLLRSLEIISSLTESKTMFTALTAMTANIRAGSTLKDSMARHPKYFPLFWTYLIEAGESSGSLPVVLKELAKNVEANNNLKKKMISALIYPIILIIASIAVILLFMLKIIPVFQKLFAQFNAKLPPLTMSIMWVSTILQQYILFFAIGVTLLIFALGKYAKTYNGRRVTDRFILSLPVFGGAVSDYVHARVNIVLSTLLSSGLNLLQGLEIVARAAGNSIFEDALTNVSQKIREGKTLAACLSEDGIFSPMMTQLVMIGEESGELPKMVRKAAEYYEERVNLLSTRIGLIIEPLVLIMVGGLIGVLALGLFLPLFTISSAIR